MRGLSLFILCSILGVQFSLADIHSELMTAIRDENIDSIKILYPESRFAPTVIELWTGMHEAAYWNKVEAARTLYSLGADFTSPDGNGWTPIYIARAKGHIEMIAFLFSIGAR